MAFIEFISIGFQLCDQRYPAIGLSRTGGGPLGGDDDDSDPYFMIFKQFQR